ncbi:MAG: hypothetical protein AAGI54_10440 [Planctomycetota bacterium]
MARWHLIDRAGEPALALRAAAATGESVLVAADASLARLAQHAGVRRGAYVSSPMGQTRLAGPAIRAALRRGGATTCLAWSRSAATVAQRWGGLKVEVTSSTTVAPTWQLGAEPTVEARRVELRDQWGVTDCVSCVLAVGGDPVSGDAYDAAMAVGLAREASLAAGSGELRLVVRPSQPGRVHACSLWRDFGLTELLIAEPRAVEPWVILPAVDAVLDLGPQPTAWRSWIEDRGLPIVGPAWLPSRHGPVVDVRRAAGEIDQAINR